jgi:hypothetical protein
MLMAITTVATYLPAAQETAEAASKWTYWFTGSYQGFSRESTELSQFTDHFVVEKGNKELYLRDVVCAYRYDGDESEDLLLGSQLSGVKYESKNTDILTVDSKTGKINAKKTGTALVKITWKKQTVYGAIKVISSSDMEEYKTANKTAVSCAKKILKACGDKLTTAAALKAFKLGRQMTADDLVAFHYDSWTDESGNYGTGYESIVYSMDGFNAETKLREVNAYLDERNPFATTGNYMFKISSLSGSGKTVTATLSDEVTKDQMAGAQYNRVLKLDNGYVGVTVDESQIGTKNLTFNIYLRDTKTGKFIKGAATIKTGSKEVAIKCESSLTKGRKYELMEWDYSGLGITDWSGENADWLRDDWIHNGKSTFKAK